MQRMILPVASIAFIAVAIISGACKNCGEHPEIVIVPFAAMAVAFLAAWAFASWRARP